ncbi:HNH endonuclease signature motif containing protein [Paludisphaera borealis]|uniref:HNH nuclease domain-containing protein n=1 Tax=Paludisphaera borealis TaxID=1387353 RepID=A0A1U7CNH3_9BACT|nr:HNH endonuclease signature motif containing protein [Paludisphaera borealis]APW60471.1 hypothetical protein BSF38_01941 [Paludisphaera borealis]
MPDIPYFTGRPDGRIPQHKPPPPRTESAEGRKARKKIYNSAAWKKCRALALRRQPLCPECLKNGVHSPSVEVHHVKDLAEGGDQYSLDNLQPLCKMHHGTVTRWRMYQGKHDDGQTRPTT